MPIPTPSSKRPGGTSRLTDGPIPGQSLTRTPGNYPFEQPPEFTDPDEAIEAVITSLRKPEAVTRLLNIIELGTPIVPIAGTIIQTGFMEGKWSVDVALLMYEPIAMVLYGLAEMAGITPSIGYDPEPDETLEMLVDKVAAQLEENPQVEPEVESEEVMSGFLTRPR